MKQLSDIKDLRISHAVEIKQGQALIIEDGTVIICRDMHIAHPHVQAAVLKQVYGYGRPPKVEGPSAKSNVVELDKPAPFIDTTVGEEDEVPPAEFDMGAADKPWLNKVHGLAHATPNEKVEGWDTP